MYPDDECRQREADRDRAANHVDPASIAAREEAAVDAFNARVFNRLRERAALGHGAALSLTRALVEPPGRLRLAIRGFMLSPLIEPRHIDATLAELRAARPCGGEPLGGSTSGGQSSGGSSPITAER